MIDFLVAIFVLWLLPNNDKELHDPDQEMYPYIVDHFENKGDNGNGGEN